MLTDSPKRYKFRADQAMRLDLMAEMVASPSTFAAVRTRKYLIMKKICWSFHAQRSEKYVQIEPNEQEPGVMAAPRSTETTGSQTQNRPTKRILNQQEMDQLKQSWAPKRHRTRDLNDGELHAISRFLTGTLGGSHAPPGPSKFIMLDVDRDKIYTEEEMEETDEGATKDKVEESGEDEQNDGNA